MNQLSVHTKGMEQHDLPRQAWEYHPTGRSGWKRKKAGTELDILRELLLTVS
jgi:hypothetical protein